MRCVRCGKVLNLEDRRCPQCLASLTNQQIGQMEVAATQLREIAGIERAQMTTRYARQGLGTGAALGGLGMLITGNLWAVAAGILAGAGVGWFTAWRNWGQYRALFLFCAIMLPIVVPLTMNPFAMLATICVGAVLGLAVQLNRGR